MMKKSLIVFLSFGALALAGVVAFQLAGIWQIGFSVVLSGEEAPCVFQGTVTVQDTLRGASTVNLQSGPSACPSQITADLISLSVDGSSLTGTLDGGQEFGTVEFEGTLVPAQGLEQSRTAETAERLLAPMNTTFAAGSFVITSGPFSDNGGSWDAVFQGPLSQIPLLSPLGLAGLASLLLAAAFYLQRRKGLLTR